MIYSMLGNTSLILLKIKLINSNLWQNEWLDRGGRDSWDGAWGPKGKMLSWEGINLSPEGSVFSGGRLASSLEQKKPEVWVKQ